MTTFEDDRNPPFRAMVRASGLAEVWTHVNDMEKFGQFGWRCTNKENSYANDTLVGNWNEERFDVSKQSEAKRIPSQHDHYFETTYGVARHPHAFPGHQPENDSVKQKAIYNSWETTTRSAYVDPKVRLQPVQSAAATETK
ncbi:hypothetical protein KUTeg_009127 [Tegillarca granosa]|uniref:Uncharacterized protein n=1 Tax=Tegillarca granosa TaxID=220873 RepID=A0ABQ9F7H7_TEGGR|nr:hypothetical protein KUTeg_009127 [Tegillarca granosa]